MTVLVGLGRSKQCHTFCRTNAATQRLGELVEVRAKADRDVTQKVARLKHAGVSWLEIGEVMNTQRQNAQRRYQNLDETLYTARVQRTVFGWIVKTLEL